MQARKKNMERMAEVVPDSDEQALQHFISNSSWDERAVLDQVALEADELLGGSEESALLIDESAMTKKGKKSVGVSRQWSGRLGKVDNCQVGVYAALSRGDTSTLIDSRLYLPKEWVVDKARCEGAGVPTSARSLKSKAELALEMVRHNRQLGVRFSWVGMDGQYGKDPGLLRALEDDGEVFVADVHKDQRVYLEDPQPRVPEATPGPGPKYSRLVTASESVRVDQYIASAPDSAWRRLTLRGSTKGPLRAEVLHRKIWLWDGKEDQPRRWHLIARREIDNPGEIKYSLSNAPMGASVQRLATMQCQRYAIERAFQDGKSHVGLDHYQSRGWRAWHRHMALVMMAMLYMLKEKIEHKQNHPLLSCADIEILLAHCLPRRDKDPEQVLEQMYARHRKRQAAIDSAYRKQQLTGAGRPLRNVTK